MALLSVKAQARSFSEVRPYTTYDFHNKHKTGWMNFWKEMGGDKEKILSFAKEAKISSPEVWYQELHKFLFDFYSGDVSLMKVAAKTDTFSAFLAEIVKNHITNPKDKNWYLKKGINEKTFIRIMETASLMENPDMSIAYIDARMRDCGNYIYSEFLLSKAGELEEKMSLVSSKNKQAYEIEKEVMRDKMPKFVAGDVVSHALYPIEQFEVVSTDDKTYLDLGSISGLDVNRMNRELEATGLVIGVDFFIKSDGPAWILNIKLDMEQSEILSKYGVEETDASNEESYEASVTLSNQDGKISKITDVWNLIK